MKKIAVLYLLVWCSMDLSAAEGSEKSFRFYDINGVVSYKGSFRYTIFGQSIYGLGNDIEIAAHPLMMFISPSFDVKYAIIRSEQYSLAGLSGVSYPTMMMRLVAMKGTGGLISPEFEIPQMVSLRTGIVGTVSLGTGHFLSGSALFEFAVNNSSLEPGTSIDLPLIAPRSAVYYKNAGFTFALSSEGVISSYFDYHCKTELFLFPFTSKKYDSEYLLGQQDLFLETTGNILWNITETSRLSPGFKLTYGDYPFGGQWHLFPVIDFVKWIE